MTVVLINSHDNKLRFSFNLSVFYFLIPVILYLLPEDRALLESNPSADTSGRWQGRERFSLPSFVLCCQRPKSEKLILDVLLLAAYADESGKNRPQVPRYGHDG